MQFFVAVASLLELLSAILYTRFSYTYRPPLIHVPITSQTPERNGIDFATSIVNMV